MEEHILAQIPGATPVLLVYNKADISGRVTGEMTHPAYPAVAISARSGAGLETLVAQVKALAGLRAAGEGAFMARRRHLHALQLASVHLQSALDQAQSGMGELVAEELKAVQEHLGEITGEVTSDDLLGAIFSQFCIGK